MTAGPQKTSAARHPVGHVRLQVNPGRIMFGEENQRFPAVLVRPQQRQIGLVARKDRQGERTVFHPGHFAQIREVPVVPFDPGRFTTAVR